MGQALYRKYRSKSLSEIIGQEHVTTTLTNALKQGRISHAYLLTGPRGVGKTSIARILAHEINGLAYGDEAHLDIIEIDAASNRRIDEIRDLRDRVNTAPSAAKYKVYIIDEVHMLTKEAFNALLKTLEEPPAHVVFILATTEAHKLPDTIISRTQRYSFRPVPHDQVVNHLKFIAKQEAITIDDAALELIAEHGDGSFRDSISLLDQTSSTTTQIGRIDVENILGLAPAERITTLRSALNNSAGAIVTALSALYNQGYEPAMVANQLSASIRLDVINQQSTDPGNDLRLLQKLLDVPAGRSPKQLLELVLLGAASQPLGAALEPAATVVVPPANAGLKPEPAATHTAISTKKADPVLPSPDPKPAITSTKHPSALPNEMDIATVWQTALNEIKKQYNTLYGIARMARPELHGDTLTLTLKFAFHQKRLNEAKNRKLLADIIEALVGRPIEINCIVGETSKVAVAAPDVSAISSIFGGAELLES